MALEKLTPGQRFAEDFEVVRLLAEGGMGAVYVARQVSTGHERALKVMHPQLVADDANRARFQQEAQVGARIDSDHVVQVVGAGIDAPTGTPWLAMELMRGEELGAMLDRRGALPMDEARKVLDQLGHALAAAHRIGVVHRDLKPENVFVAASRRQDTPFTIKVLDFGISKIVAENRTAATATRAVGSPLWMAPEQTERNGRISPATDVWALGLIAFRVLSGKVFWLAANTESATLESILREMLIDPMEPASQRAHRLGAPVAVSPALDGWIARCLERDPARRFPNAGEAMAALEALWPQMQRPSVPFAATAALSQPSYAPPQPSYAPPQPTVAWPVNRVLPAPPSTSFNPLWVAAGFAAFAFILGVPVAFIFWSHRRAVEQAQAEEAASIARDAVLARSADEARLEDLQRYVNESRESPARNPRYRVWNDAGAPETASNEGIFAALGAGETRNANSPDAGLRRTRSSSATVRASPPMVTGLLSPEAIRRVMLRNLGQVNHCYEQGLASDPTLAGRVVVRFVIGGTGAVLGATASENVASPSVGVCISNVVRRLQFPQPEGGGVVTVSYPFNLEPGDE